MGDPYFGLGWAGDWELWKVYQREASPSVGAERTGFFFMTPYLKLDVTMLGFPEREHI